MSVTDSDCALSCRELLDKAGPYFGGEPPDDEALFDRLTTFGWEIWRVRNHVQREYARQIWIDYLKKNILIGRPSRLVDTAIQHGKDSYVQEEADAVRSYPRLIDELLAEPEEPTAWVVEGYVARGEVTVFAGAPKVGKTTLLAQLAAAVARGTSFIGRRVEQTAVLLIDLEQHLRRTKARFRGLGTEGLPLHVFNDTAVKFDVSVYVREHGIGLVVVDSLSKYWDIQDENDAAQVSAALRHIRAIAAATDAAVVLIHHTRKSGGEEGMDVRGSSAITAAVDISVSLKRRGKGTTRLLEAISRDEATPGRLVVALEDGLYRALGSEEDVRHREQRVKVLKALTEEPTTAQDLADATGLPVGTVRPVLNALHEEGVVRREGTGVGGQAFRYSRNGGSCASGT
jgi:KaiC/GvpD/RAD55 family RecA-like ATPase